MSAAAAGALVGAAAGLLAAPYLARLTRTVPDRDDDAWWRGARPGRGRLLATAGVALAVGALAGGAAGWSSVLPAFLALALFGTPLIVIDVEHHRLPFRLLDPLAASTALLLVVAALPHGAWSALLRAAGAAALVYLVFAAMHRFVPGSFGGGDVLLGGVAAAGLGWFGWIYVVYGILGAFVLALLAAVPLLLTRRATGKTPLPFGPALVVGPLLVLLFDLVPSTTF